MDNRMTSQAEEELQDEDADFDADAVDRDAAVQGLLGTLSKLLNKLEAAGDSEYPPSLPPLDSQSRQLLSLKLNDPMIYQSYSPFSRTIVNQMFYSIT